jgi:hypothetical protein
MRYGSFGESYSVSKNIKKLCWRNKMQKKLKTENILLRKLRQNWRTMKNFLENSGVPVSSETARRAIFHNEPITIPPLVLLCKYLGFDGQEIKKILKKAGDEDFSSLIGGYLSPEQEALVAIFDKIEAKSKVLDFAEIIAQNEGKSVKKELKLLKARKG